MQFPPPEALLSIFSPSQNFIFQVSAQKSHLQNLLGSPQVRVKLLQILYSPAQRVSAYQGTGCVGWWPQIPCIPVQTENTATAHDPEEDGLQLRTC